MKDEISWIQLMSDTVSEKKKLSEPVNEIIEIPVKAEVTDVMEAPILTDKY